MRIGELLVMNGLITEEQLEQALKQQLHTQKKLGEILTENGIITERQVAEALEFQLGVPVINMNETIIDKNTIQLIHESIARKHCIVPIERKGGKIKVAMIDPLNHEAIKEVQMSTGMRVQPFIATRAELEQAIIQNYGVTESVEVIDGIIQSAVQQKASDIHLDPQEEGLIVKYRIDNVLRTQKTIPKPMQEALIERIKIISNFNTAERRLPQDGRIQKQVDNKQIDIRVSTLPTINGESIVLRIVDRSQEVIKFADLALSEANLQKIEKVIQRPNGMILISGPSGSGKTSTLYSVLNELNREKLKIITIEDPIEYRMAGTTQVEVNERIGLTFAYGLRSILHQDPNIVMAGDIRDAETAEIAARASLAGRLVLSSIHGSNALKTISRLVHMGADPYLIASSLSCVVAQRLVRRICGQCAQTLPVSDEEMRLFEAHGIQNPDDRKIGNKGMTGNFRSFMAAQISGKITVTRGNGCSPCNNTGYRGYLAVHEVLIVDEPLRGLITQNRPINELEQHLEKNGYKTMLYDGLLKAREGMTTVEEVLKVVNSN